MESGSKFIGLKMKTISESGIVGNDGRLRMPMERINAFLSQNKGRRVIVRFETAEPGSSELQLAYYYNYIVPTVKKALYEQGNRMTETGVDRWLINNYPGSNDLILPNGEPKVIGRQLTVSEMTDLLEWLKQYAAENLYVYIEDPKTI